MLQKKKFHDVSTLEWRNKENKAPFSVVKKMQSKIKNFMFVIKHNEHPVPHTSRRMTLE